MSNPPDIDWNDLRAAQDEITRWASEQFPHRTDHHAIHKLMVEEIPEMAMHKKEKGTEAIGTELADCLILLLDLASLWEVDVVEALRTKMKTNYARQWKMDNNGIMQHTPDNPLRHCTNPNMTSEAAEMLAAIKTGRCTFYPDCYCGAEVKPVPEPARQELVYCPYCRSCRHTTPITPDTPIPNRGSGPNDTHVCTECDMGFDDSIPF